MIVDQEVCIVKVYFIMNWVQLTDGSELIPEQVVRISDCETFFLIAIQV